jgi:hypothetical protein
MATIKGGDKFALALSQIAEQLSRPGSVRVGFLENATGPDGQPIAVRAAANEFGTSKIPPRPFFRNMIAEKESTWPVAVAENLKATDYDQDLTLQRVGEGIASDLQMSIQQTNSPPLAESTVKRKGFDKPLIEHGDMIRAVSFEVKS